VNNAAKHSGCSSVQIDFGCRDSVLNLCVKDNGSGFTAVDDNDGHGLRNMARRAEAHRGRLTIVSPPGEGTLVEFELRMPRKGQI
jgi:signal transduction histidine kinase